MYNRYDIEKYYLEDSIIHRLNPFFKILSTIIVIITICICQSIIDYCLLGLYLFTTLIWTNIDLKIYYHNLISVLPVVVFFGLLGLIFSLNVSVMLAIILKLIYILMYISVLTYTTPPTEITYGIEKIFSPFDKINLANKIALKITLWLRFIPIFTSEKERILNSEKIRNITYSNNIKENIIFSINNYKIIFNSSFKKLKRLANVMYLRLYNYCYKRNNYRLNYWKFIDTLLIILNIIMLLAVIVD